MCRAKYLLLVFFENNRDLTKNYFIFIYFFIFLMIYTKILHFFTRNKILSQKYFFFGLDMFDNLGDP